jgi:hypothetical protein
VRCQDRETLGEMPRARDLLVRCQEKETFGSLGEMPRSGSLVRCQDQGLDQEGL